MLEYKVGEIKTTWIILISVCGTNCQNTHYFREVSKLVKAEMFME